MVLDPATAALGIGGGLIDFVGGLFGNNSAEDAARDQRKWQERMTRQAHQIEVTDLQRAGLNPMLSAMKGSGAAVPSGAVARTSENPAAGLANSARNLASTSLANQQAQQTIENLKAENERIRAATKGQEINNIQQGVLTPAYEAAGSAVDYGVKKAKGIAADLGLTNDPIQEVMDALPNVESKKANGNIQVPTSGFNLERLGSRIADKTIGNSEARKWWNGEKGLMQSIFDASKTEVRSNSAKNLNADQIRDSYRRRQEKAKDYFKWSPNR